MAVSDKDRKKKEAAKKIESGLVRRDFWLNTDSTSQIENFKNTFDIQYKNDTMNLILKHFNQHYILFCSFVVESGTIQQKYPIIDLLELPQMVYKFCEYIDRSDLFPIRDIARELIMNMEYEKDNIKFSLTRK